MRWAWAEWHVNHPDCQIPQENCRLNWLDEFSTGESVKEWKCSFPWQMSVWCEDQSWAQDRRSWCPVGQEAFFIFVLSCCPPGRRTGQKIFSRAHLWWGPCVPSTKTLAFIIFRLKIIEDNYLTDRRIKDHFSKSYENNFLWKTRYFLPWINVNALVSMVTVTLCFVLWQQNCWKFCSCQVACRCGRPSKYWKCSIVSDLRLYFWQSVTTCRLLIFSCTS